MVAVYASERLGPSQDSVLMSWQWPDHRMAYLIGSVLQFAFLLGAAAGLTLVGKALKMICNRKSREKSGAS